jgi:two-component system KDP operon response regulator KdpE
MHKRSVLVVEEDAVIERLISRSLTQAGFDVHVAATSEDSLDLAAEIHPDAVVLGLERPSPERLALLDELKAWSDLPAIVVTADATAQAARQALDRGADDYLAKPFAPAELAARVRAVLRRRHRWRGRRHRVGQLIIDLDRRTIVASAEGGPVPSRPISRGGWRLLETFLDHPGRVLYRDELLEAAFGPDYRGDSDFLQEQVRRLRRALGVPSWSEGPIRTVHGVGYVYDVDGEMPDGRPRRPKPAVQAAPSATVAGAGGRTTA